MAGQDAPKLYCTADAPQEDWDGARPDEQVVSQAWQAWRDEVAFAEQHLAQSEDLGALRDHHGTPLPLRDIVVHMVEEYARHCGHADLLRECIDGRIGQ